MPAMLIPDPSLLELTIPLRIAMQAKQGVLIVPLWFEYREARFWCATQADSVCAKALRRVGHCAFDISTNDMPYRGLRGQAKVTCVAEAGAAQLDRLLVRYLGGLDSPLARRLRKRAATEVALVLEPTRLTHWDYAARMRDSLPGA